MTSKKLLVTGSAGFIGSAVIRHIINNPDHSVINVEKLSNVTDTWKISNIRDSKEESRTNNELVCIDELMWDGVSGDHLRGKYESN